MKSQIFFLFFLADICYGKDTYSGENISHPCDSLEDLDCIRDYFANSGQCTKISHKDGEVIEKDKNVAYMPLINATLYSSEVGCIFYGSSITAFYIDKDSNELVMSINFEGMNIFSPHGSLHISQRRKKPLVVEDTVNATYSGELTAIIPSTGLDGIKAASVSSYNTNAYPTIAVGPKISQSSDPVVSKTFEALLADVPTIVQELLLSKGPYFFYVFLQNYICDYGYEFTGKIFQ
ncbi:hypothetical protein ABMA28_003401 [Loxostege sticticalis]|uniref:Uncharacterized protein n=1 Tax=Loxostege sticticalis TaxID=481309 RepID=A0ABD0SYN0_LOXSC